MQQIAIIGAAGKMGSWLTKYFSRRGLHISAYDVNRKSLQASKNLYIASSIADCVKDADLVLISVPVRVTPRTIYECARNMKSGAIISEISSVKHRTFRALKKVPREIRPLCIHPMFGPGATEKLQPKILLVPVRNEKAELKMVHCIFENASVKVLPNAKAHDASVATVLGMTYFANIVFARVVASEDVSALKEVAGTTFALQSLVAESILTNEPDLVVALIRENPYAKRYIRQFLKAASTVSKMASAKDDSKLKADLEKTKLRLQKWQDLQQSYKKMYEIIESLK
ncbi:MAG TPA: prephenate dehydrogenase/arogenate dehydrogenase family protein [Nitrososphaera sp.]|nr:prephenate dehydrogenase/arogenate dehydrogenase family protein [Nitrososphaera sp.]